MRAYQKMNRLHSGRSSANASLQQILFITRQSATWTSLQCTDVYPLCWLLFQMWYSSRIDGNAWWMNITKGDAMAPMASTLTSTKEFLHRRQRPYAGPMASLRRQEWFGSASECLTASFSGQRGLIDVNGNCARWCYLTIAIAFQTASPVSWAQLKASVLRTAAIATAKAAMTPRYYKRVWSIAR